MTADGAGRGGQGWASLAIAGLAAVVVVAGLVLAGGPGQARKERRDEARLRDLDDLSRHIGCLWRLGDGATFPADLAETPECPGPVRLTDRETGTAYRVEPLKGGAYRLCAPFELSPADQPRWAQRRDGDCVVFDLPQPASPAPLPPSEQSGVRSAP